MRYDTITSLDAACTAVHPFGYPYVYTIQRPEYGKIVWCV